MRSAPWLFAVAAGAASSLLFVLSAMVPALGIFIFFVAPLPLFLAGLSRGPRAAMIASATGMLLTGIAAGPVGGLGFFFIVGLGPVVLVYLALLQSPDYGRTGWYPLGGIIAVAAVLAAGYLLIADIALLVSGAGGLKAALSALVAELFSDGLFDEIQQAFGGAIDRDGFRELMVRIFPASAAVNWMAAQLGSFALAQMILKRNEGALRHGERFEEIELPHSLLIGVVAAGALAFLPTPFAFVAGNLFAVLLIPYFLLGLAVIHAISAAWPARQVMLGLFYLVVIMIVWVALPVILVGLLEPVLRLRDKQAARSDDADEG